MVKSKKGTRVEKSAAVVVRAKGAVAASDDDALVAEAMRRAREVYSAGEALVHGYGEWLFANVFAGDTKSVLDADAAPPEAWGAIVEACGSARLPLSRATLSNSLRVAAWDKRLADGAWSGLSYSNKVALLPLDDPKAMRAAARHVLAASLTVRATNEYVANLRAPGEKATRLTPQLAQRRVTRVATPFEDDATVSKLATQLAKLDREDKAAVKERVEHTIKQLERLLAAVSRG
jgi:hypothetical protein